MSAGDIVILFGWLVSAWSVGFGAGYTFTKFRDAINDATRDSA